MIQRARRAEDKEQRRQAFLDAAEALFAESSYADVKMADVAAAAGMAKGSLFVYFPTKEHLFLDLLEARLWAWFGGLQAALESSGRISAKRLAHQVAQSLATEETFTRLLAILSSILEHNVTVERVVAFKQELRVRIEPAGALLEKRLGARRGSGVQLLMHIYALIVGLRQLTDPSPVAAAALEREDLALFRFDFADELEHALVVLFTGVQK